MLHVICGARFREIKELLEDKLAPAALVGLLYDALEVLVEKADARGHEGERRE
ncbi:MAG: hypothetical protein AB9866_23815 [Syntrophobacteraceae bacterium]